MRHLISFLMESQIFIFFIGFFLTTAPIIGIILIHSDRLEN